MDRVSRSLLLTGPHRLEWVQEQIPHVPPDSLLVRTVAGAISIGSELPVYLGTARSAEPTRYPRMTGYESVGIVEAVGSGVEKLRAGDRVVAFYGHRTAAIVPQNKGILVPTGVSDEVALLSILTCDAAKGVRKVAPLPEERVLVTGAGAIGLFTLFILNAYGVAGVDMIEPDERRHALAQELGARQVLFPDQVTDELGAYSAGFECSANNDAFALLQHRLTPHGRLCILSDGNVEPLLLTPAFHQKELVVVGSSDGWDYHRHAAWFFDRLRRIPSRLTAVFQLDVQTAALAETFEQLASGTIKPVKVLVWYH